MTPELRRPLGPVAFESEMTQMGKLRVGIYGFGNFAQNELINQYSYLKDKFEVVCVCVRTEASAAKVRARFTYPVYTDEDAFLNSDIDVVDVCVNMPNTYDCVRKALATGKHVISPKPLCATAELGGKLIKEFERTRRKGQVWSVQEDWNHLESLDKVKELVDNNFSGLSSTLGYCTSPYLKDQDYLQPQGVRFHWCFAGVHQMAGIQHILGEVKTVQTFVFADNFLWPPSVSIAMRFAGGAEGTWTQQVGTDRLKKRLTVLGRGAIALGVLIAPLKLWLTVPLALMLIAVGSYLAYRIPRRNIFPAKFRVCDNKVDQFVDVDFHYYKQARVRYIVNGELKYSQVLDHSCTGFQRTYEAFWKEIHGEHGDRKMYRKAFRDLCAMEAAHNSMCTEDVMCHLPSVGKKEYTCLVDVDEMVTRLVK